MALLDGLLTTFSDDFAKYKKHVPASRLREVFRSVSLQAGGKFKYARVETESASREIKEALDLLIRAGLAYKVPHTSARGLPLGAQVRPKRFKVLPFDLGLHQRLAGLPLSDYLVAGETDWIHKGALAEIYTGLELLHNGDPRARPELHYWHREARASNAEVDYVIERGGRILPIEVKAGTRGQMQSMRLFLRERGLQRGVRISLENFGAYGDIRTLPVYAVWTLCAD